MKKILVTAFIAGTVSLSAFAQGTVTGSFGAGMFKYTTATDGSGAVGVTAGNPVSNLGGYGQFHWAVYGASSTATVSLLGTQFGGIPNLATWVPQSSSSISMSRIGPSAGAMPNFGLTMDASLGGAGTVIKETLVAWAGTYGDFVSAVNAEQQGTKVLLGWSGSSLTTGSLSWLQTLGSSSSPSSFVTGTSAFNGITLVPIVPVPEPATFALAGLGAAAMLIFRRRK